jgi:heat shock protein HtpX
MANANESLLDEAEIERHLQGSRRRKIAGIALLAILSVGSLELFGPSLGQTTLYILLACTLMPLGRWYYGLRDAKKLTKFQPATKSNPEHARIDRLLEETLPSTGMKEKPQLMISPRLQPNLSATGRNPANSVVIATEGIFLLNLSDDEIRTLLAHELAHVKNRDLALNSLLSALASLSTILITFGYPHLLNGVSLASEKSALINPSTFLSTPLVYFGALCLLKLLTLYVNRAGESTADGLAAKWTGKPSALITALQKLEDYGRQEARSSEPHTSQIKSSHWRHKLGKEHPATDARIKALEAMSSSAVTGQQTR